MYNTIDVTTVVLENIERKTPKKEENIEGVTNEPATQKVHPSATSYWGRRGAILI